MAAKPTAVVIPGTAPPPTDDPSTSSSNAPPGIPDDLSRMYEQMDRDEDDLPGDLALDLAGGDGSQPAVKVEIEPTQLEVG